MRIVLGLVDGIALIWISYASWFKQDRPLVLFTVSVLLAWQFLENGLFRRRFQSGAAAPYPGGLVWPNIAFAVTLWTCVTQRLTMEIRGGLIWAEIGAAMSVIGVFLRLWAFRSLGADFLRSPGTNNSLILQGPYLFLRHPAARGFLLLAAGAATAWRSLWGLAAVMILVLPSLVYVCRREEHANSKAGLLPGDLTFSQRMMQHPLNVLCYENLVHPLFLFLFTRYFRFESIYQQLSGLAGAGNPRDAKILDLACGTAWFARRIIREYQQEDPAQIIAIDLSQEMLTRARQLARKENIDPQHLQFLCHDIHDLNSFPAASFDRVWLCGALHQIPNPDQVLKESARLLKQGGLIFCQTFVENFPAWMGGLYRLLERVFGFVFFPSADLLWLFRSAGYRLRGIKSSGSALFICAEKEDPNSRAHNVLVLGGTGCTGRLIVEDMVQHLKHSQIDVGSRHPGKETGYSPCVGVLRVDVTENNEGETVSILARYDLVVLAIGPFEAFQDRVHRLCLSAQVDCIDINDCLSAAKAIFGLSHQAQLTGTRILTGMGLSPGLTTLLLLRSMKPASDTTFRLRSRLFIGGNQKAGLAAIKAMLSSFGPLVPEIRDGRYAEVSSDDRQEESRYLFPGLVKPLRVFHYPTPEAWTLAALAGPKGIERMDYRVHFQGLPPAFIWMLRKTALLRSRAVLGSVAHIVLVVHDILRRSKDRGILAQAECTSGSSTVHVVARAISSYQATAAFASSMAQLALEDKLMLQGGVYSLESSGVDHAELVELLRMRSVIVEGHERVREIAHGRELN